MTSSLARPAAMAAAILSAASIPDSAALWLPLMRQTRGTADQRAAREGELRHDWENADSKRSPASTKMTLACRMRSGCQSARKFCMPKHRPPSLRCPPSSVWEALYELDEHQQNRCPDSDLRVTGEQADGKRRGVRVLSSRATVLPSAQKTRARVCHSDVRSRDRARSRICSRSCRRRGLLIVSLSVLLRVAAEPETR